MDTHPTPKKSSARAGIFGALIGAGALLGSVLVLSTGAGAQDDPTPVEPEPTEETVTVEADEADDSVDFFIDVDEFDLDELPEEWRAHAECIDGIIGDEPAIDENLSDAELDTLFEQLESTFMAAEEQCADLLPAEAKAEIEAWKAYDDCLAENGFSFDDEFEDIVEGIDLESFDLDDEMFEGAVDIGNVVFVETADGSSIVELGEGDASVTITKSGDAIDVTTTGDATVESFDWDEAFVMDDPAFGACEDKLPEDVFGFDVDLAEAVID